MTGFRKFKVKIKSSLPGFTMAVILTVFIVKAQQSVDTTYGAADSAAFAPVNADRQKSTDNTLSGDNNPESIQSADSPEQENKIETPEPSVNRGSYYGGEAYSASRSQRGMTATGGPGGPSGRRKLAEIPIDTQEINLKEDSASVKTASEVTDTVKPVTKKPYAKKTVKISKLKKSEKVLIFTTATTAVVGGVVIAILVNSLRKGEDDKGIPEPPPPPGF